MVFSARWSDYQGGHKVPLYVNEGIPWQSQLPYHLIKICFDTEESRTQKSEVTRRNLTRRVHSPKYSRNGIGAFRSKGKCRSVQNRDSPVEVIQSSSTQTAGHQSLERRHVAGLSSLTITVSDYQKQGTGVWEDTWAALASFIDGPSLTGTPGISRTAPPQNKYKPSCNTDNLFYRIPRNVVKFALNSDLCQFMTVFDQKLTWEEIGKW